MIIAVGITCLVGILTAIDTILFSMNDNFNRLGANSFNIRPSNSNVRGNRSGRNAKRAPNITFEQALSFKKKFIDKGNNVSVYSYCTSEATVYFENKKTDPNIRFYGVDQHYLKVSSYDLEAGRNFTEKEIEVGAHLVIVGRELVDKFFFKDAKASLNQLIKINDARYKIIGVLADRGSSMNDSGNKRVFVPLLNSKKYFGYPNKNYSVVGGIKDATRMSSAISDATGIMRGVRKLKVTEENNFTISKSDGILNQLKEMTTEIRLSSMLIALMTLFGAAIGLMNIMLVSVTERTKEIGIRKALGAPRRNIMFQFLIEAVIVCLLGGILGIILGILIGFGVAILIGGNFILPINWMVLGIVVCVIVGVSSGIYPALKASKLDPIEALRYE